MSFHMKYPQAWRGFGYVLCGIVVLLGRGGKKVLVSMRPFSVFLIAVVSSPLRVVVWSEGILVFE